MSNYLIASKGLVKNGYENKKNEMKETTIHNQYTITFFSTMHDIEDISIFSLGRRTRSHLTNERKFKGKKNIPSLVKVHQEHNIISKASQPMRCWHCNNKCKNIINECVERLLGNRQEDAACLMACK